MTDTATNPNADLETMDQVALMIEYERLKQKGRAAVADTTRDIVQALSDPDLLRLTAIIQLNRRRSGAPPKESASVKKAKKPAKETATESDLLSI